MLGEYADMITLLCLLIGKVSKLHNSMTISGEDKSRVKARKIKSRNRYRLALIGSIVTDIIISICVAVMIVLGILSMIKSTSGYTILSLLKQEEQASSSSESDWDFSSNDADKEETSGGLYPKDKTLKLYAELLEITNKSVTDALAITGQYVNDAYVIGTIYREHTGAFNMINNSGLASLYTDLLYESPVCGKSSCAYINAGVSHYFGGSVVNGIDKGDPYTQVIDTSTDLYKRFKGKYGHAIGITQNEIPYVYAHMSREYGNTKKIITGSYTDPASIQQQVIMDKELGFIRPNNSYVPDEVYNATILLATYVGAGDSNYRSVVNSSDYKSLSDENKNAVNFIYATAGYNAGQVHAVDSVLVRELIGAVKSGKIDSIEDMLKGHESDYWNSKTCTAAGSYSKFVSYVKSNYGITSPSGGEYAPSWRGLFSVCVGRAVYTQLKLSIDAAEKSESTATGNANGNWIDYPGSGKFGDNNSIFYNKTIGCRWFRQSSNTSLSNTVSPSGVVWGKLWFTPGQNDTITQSGCGIITLAMTVSNLTNTDITPDMVLSLVNNSTYMYGLLSTSLVSHVATTYGLQAKRITGSTLQSQIDKELAKGNIAVVWLHTERSGQCIWKNTPGYHYVGIRGKTADGRYLCLNSCGFGRDPVYVMSTALAWNQFSGFIQGNGAYIIGNSVN